MRSDGLRQFVALVAFVERYAKESPPVLLIDEAERHLHYDAQADLVRVFTEQQAAAKIIYTTHSAGCLPKDLGTGVRVIEPTGPKDVSSDQWDRSKVRNWFWTESPGFSPLLLGMGAGSFAFAATRFALITEGISDVILLATLFREACGLDDLDFQVAPGLSGSNARRTQEFEQVASRVAYLVDDDASGRDKRAELREAGVAARRILTYGNKLALEDLVEADVYLEAVNRELHTWHGITIESVPKKGRAKAVQDWCRQQSGKVALSKRAVAHQLLDLRTEKVRSGEVDAPQRLVAPDREPLLQRLHSDLMQLFSRHPADRSR